MRRLKTKRILGLLLSIVIVLGCMTPAFFTALADDALPGPIDLIDLFSTEGLTDYAAELKARINPTIECDSEQPMLSGHLATITVQLNPSNFDETRKIQNLELDLFIADPLVVGTLPNYADVVVSTKPAPGGTLYTLRVKDFYGAAGVLDIYTIPVSFPNGTTLDGVSALCELRGLRWYGDSDGAAKIDAGMVDVNDETSMTMTASSGFGYTVNTHGASTTYQLSQDYAGETSVDLSFTGANVPKFTYKYSSIGGDANALGHINSKVTFKTVLSFTEGLKFKDRAQVDANVVLSPVGAATLKSDGTVEVVWEVEMLDKTAVDLSVTINGMTWAPTAAFVGADEYEGVITSTISASSSAVSIVTDDTTTQPSSMVISTDPTDLTTASIKIIKPKEEDIPDPPTPSPEKFLEDVTKTNIGYTYKDANGVEQVRKYVSNRPIVDKDNYNLVYFELGGFSAPTGMNLEENIKNFAITDPAVGYTLDGVGPYVLGYDSSVIAPIKICTGKYTGGVGTSYNIIVYYDKGDDTVDSVRIPVNYADDAKTIDLYASSHVPEGKTVVGVKFEFPEITGEFAVSTEPSILYEAIEIATMADLAEKGSEFFNYVQYSYTYKDTPYSTDNLLDADKAGAVYDSVQYVMQTVKGQSKDVSDPPAGRYYYMAGDKVTYTLTYNHTGLITGATDGDPGSADNEVPTTNVRIRDDLPHQLLRDVNGNVIVSGLQYGIAISNFEPNNWVNVPASAIEKAPAKDGDQDYFILKFDKDALEAAGAGDDGLEPGQCLVVKYDVTVSEAATEEIKDNKYYTITNRFFVKWQYSGNSYDPGGKPGEGPGEPGQEHWGKYDQGYHVLQVSAVVPKIGLKKWYYNNDDYKDDTHAKVIPLNLAQNTNFTDYRMTFAIEASNQSDSIPLPVSYIVDRLPAYMYLDKADIANDVTVQYKAKGGNWAAVPPANYEVHVGDYDATGASLQTVLFIINRELTAGGAFRITYKAGFGATDEHKPARGAAIGTKYEYENYAYYYATNTEGQPMPGEAQGSSSSSTWHDITANSSAADIKTWIDGLNITIDGGGTARYFEQPVAAVKARSAVSYEFISARMALRKYTMNPDSSKGYIPEVDSYINPVSLGSQTRFMLVMRSLSAERTKVYEAYDILPPGITVAMNGDMVNRSALDIKLHPYQSSLANNYSKNAAFSETYTYTANGVTKTAVVASITAEMVTIDGVERQKLIFTFTTSESGENVPIAGFDFTGYGETLCLQYNANVATLQEYTDGGAVTAAFENDQSKTVQNHYAILTDESVGFVANDKDPIGISVQKSRLIDSGSSDTIFPYDDYASAGKYLMAAQSDIKYQLDLPRPGIVKFVYSGDTAKREPVQTKVNQTVTWGITFGNTEAKAPSISDYVLYDILPSDFRYHAGSAKLYVNQFAETGGTLDTSAPHVVLPDPATFTLSDGSTLLAWTPEALAVGNEAKNILTAGEVYHLTYDSSTRSSADVIGIYTNRAYLAVDDLLYPGYQTHGSWLSLEGDSQKEVVEKLAVYGVTTTTPCIYSEAQVLVTTSIGASAVKSVTTSGGTAYGRQWVPVKKNETYLYSYVLSNYSEGTDFKNVEIADIFPIVEDYHVSNANQNVARLTEWVPSFIGNVKIYEYDPNTGKTGGQITKYNVYLREATGNHAAINADETNKTFNRNEGTWHEYTTWLKIPNAPAVDAFIIDFDDSYTLKRQESLILTWNMKAPEAPTKEIVGTIAWNSAAFKVEAGSRMHISEPPKVGVKLIDNGITVNKILSAPEDDTTFGFTLTGVKKSDGMPVTFSNNQEELNFSISVNALTGEGTTTLSGPFEPGTYYIKEQTTNHTYPYTITFNGTGVTRHDAQTGTFVIEELTFIEITVTNEYIPSPSVSDDGGGTPSPSPSDLLSPSPSTTGLASPSPSSSGTTEEPSPSDVLTSSESPDPSTSVWPYPWDEELSPDGEIPLGWHQDEETGEWIYDPELPLAGGVGAAMIGLAGLGLISAGVLLGRKGKKEDAE